MWVKLSTKDGEEVDAVQLKDAGAFCQSCYPFWSHQGLDPKRMVQVFTDDGKDILTDKKQIPIIICPYCDGDVILNLKHQHEHDDTPSSTDS